MNPNYIDVDNLPNTFQYKLGSARSRYCKSTTLARQDSVSMMASEGKSSRRSSILSSLCLAMFIGVHYHHVNSLRTLYE